MKQNLAVLDWLRRWPAITPHEAYTKLGIYRLGARIFDLRERGHDIVNTEPLGNPARYVLVREADRAASNAIARLDQRPLGPARL